MAVPAGIEDRNRTSPFPFCGNRFEFRAPGSSQNCSLPVTVCNTVFASGMAHLSGLLESGYNLRDAVAKVYRENRTVIFTGDGYAKDWPREASKRGLPELKTTPDAASTFHSYKSKALFQDMGIFQPDEVDARAELMFESYAATIAIEASTLLRMTQTAIIPACVKDLAIYKDSMDYAGDRPSLYRTINSEAERLRRMLASVPGGGDVEEEAAYYCNVVKPQLEALRTHIDEAEALMQEDLYPYPKYEELVYSHWV